MEPFYKDNDVVIYNKDCRSMDELADESMQCVMTSPPFWGLRKYSGNQDLIWGGEPDCQHEWASPMVRPAHPDRSTGDHDQKGSGIFVDRIARGEQPAKAVRGQAVDFGGFCSHCGAWKGALGLEPTPDCGRPFMKLRDDLTPKEKEYALSELRKFGTI